MKKFFPECFGMLSFLILIVASFLVFFPDKAKADYPLNFTLSGGDSLSCYSNSFNPVNSFSYNSILGWAPGTSFGSSYWGCLVNGSWSNRSRNITFKTTFQGSTRDQYSSTSQAGLVVDGTMWFMTNNPIYATAPSTPGYYTYTETVTVDGVSKSSDFGFYSGVPTAGSCGSPNGEVLSTAPVSSSEFCRTGSKTAVAGTGPWTWSCLGSFGRGSASCSTVLPTCTGNVPDNATIFSSDDTGLTTNTPYTYSTSNTGTKCEYSCNSGYTWNGSSCIVPCIPSCAGIDPAAYCAGTNIPNSCNTGSCGTGTLVPPTPTLSWAISAGKSSTAPTEITWSSTNSAYCYLYKDDVYNKSLILPSGTESITAVGKYSAECFNSCNAKTTRENITVGACVPSIAYNCTKLAPICTASDAGTTKTGSVLCIKSDSNCGNTPTTETIIDGKCGGSPCVAQSILCPKPVDPSKWIEVAPN